MFFPGDLSTTPRIAAAKSEKNVTFLQYPFLKLLLNLANKASDIGRFPRQPNYERNEKKHQKCDKTTCIIVEETMALPLSQKAAAIREMIRKTSDHANISPALLFVKICYP